MKCRRGWIPALGLLIVVQACSSAAVRVMPGPAGINRVVVRAPRKPKAEVKAVKAAAKYCEERGAEAVFLADSTTYTGTIDEDAREEIRMGSRAAGAVAGSLRTVESNDAAAVFDAASGVGYAVISGKDYKAEVSFRCDP